MLVQFVIGVDTHARNHAVSILACPTGEIVDEAQFPATAAGLSRAVSWAGDGPKKPDFLAIAGFDGHAILKDIAARRGGLRAGGAVDLHRGAEVLLHELRDGKLGRMTLETPAVVSPATGAKRRRQSSAFRRIMANSPIANGSLRALF